MADTGAPYFLPYPLPTDLVRDGADAIKDLAEALAQALEDIPVKEKRIEAFAGSGTWTVPAGVTYAIAHMMGGGGGFGRNNSGGDGGNSSVAFASGTVVGPGTSKAVAADVPTTFTIAGVNNTGQSAVGLQDGAGRALNAAGAAGVFTVAAAAVTPAASITVTVGAGGAAGTDGAAGGSGYVYIEYYEEA